MPWEDLGPAQPETATSTPQSLPADIMDSLSRLGYRDYARTATSGVESGLDFLNRIVPGTPAEQQPGAMHGMAQAIVPQTPAAFGRTAGMLATGGSGLGMAIAGPAIGGLVGGMLDSQTNGPLNVGREGLQGAIEGGVGKGISAGLGAARRAGAFSAIGFPGQQTLDERAVGGALSDISPAFSNTGTADSIGRQVATGVQPELSAALEQGLQDINSQVGGGSLFRSPAIQAAFPDAPPTMTFMDAAKYIRMLGAKGWNAAGNAAGGVGGMTGRDLRAEAIDEIKAQLPQGLADQWARYTSEYGQGKILLDLMQEPNVLYPSKPGEAFPGLGMPALQAKAGQYNIQGDLAKRLTPAQQAMLENATQRGGTYSMGTDYPRGFLPTRLYGGGASESFRIPLPAHYVGNAVSVPNLPFALSAEAGTDALRRRLRNPYLGGP